MGKYNLGRSARDGPIWIVEPYPGHALYIPRAKSVLTVEHKSFLEHFNTFIKTMFRNIFGDKVL